MAINVLIVDDSSTMRKIVQRNLKQTRLDIAEIFQAGDGQEGLAVLQAQQVHLILSDWNMPNLDGLGFVQAVRANTAWDHIQIVMITTEGGEAKVQEAIGAGANGYVKKPFTADDLEAQLTSRAA
ncbi:MAG: two-component system response regulator [Nitrospirae bacterium CG18_big_fil_WC_8_21_14_2_50_70_55]|nr:response regulator [Deltaproteobacteria bacterium]OIP62645.1 MAG: two-component system response regulator [Nitrospirae bacterium CG2_30_70_394]PIQ04356.1 MAG: two-component system response regulator [Nitrospirae bacterium CG18_big_fil_WC_8_21_14_2_50_70_55]PIU79045.1 MAG: response regulator [Nitrospirae bacterium CG06_land_8_20_14_3_00_70_43]PIW82461.1 MAG: response regulator [Nitrospirae bacterium CG_4_8_14_3_um_filter_70_85]PIX83342.1 MAG: response regulator [Nitrospirae bacterium CG_4_10